MTEKNTVRTCSHCEEECNGTKNYHDGEKICDDCVDELEDFDFEIQVDAVVSIVQNVTVRAFTEHEAREKVQDDPKEYIEQDMDYRYEDLYDAVIVSVDDDDIDSDERFQRITGKHYLKLCEEAYSWREYQRSLSDNT